MSSTVMSDVMENWESILEGLRSLKDIPHVNRVYLSMLASGAAAQENLDRRSRPMRIALVGGTGTGKSTIFNALIGQRDASPSSSGRRNFTSIPHIVSHEKNRGFSADYPGAKFIPDHRFENLMLIDTPDIDGANQEHKHITRNVIAGADIIVFVTTQEKYADRELVEQLKESSDAHRWLFVLNKADQIGSNLHDSFVSFMGKIREMGFTDVESASFAVSATDLEIGSWENFRECVFEAKAIEEIEMAREDALLAHLQAALSSESTERLGLLTSKLEKHVLVYEKRATGVYLEALASNPRVKQQLSNLVRDQAWIGIGRRTPFPMSVAFRLKTRFAILALSFQLTRALTSGFTPVRMLKLVIASAVAVGKGLLPAIHLGMIIRESAQEKLNELENSLKRHLEDEIGSDVLVDKLLGGSVIDTAPSGKGHEHRQTLLSLSPSKFGRDFAEGAMESVTERLKAIQVRDGFSETREIEGLSAPLLQAVERLGDEIAEKVVGRLFCISVNIAPLVVAGHIIYRFCAAWYSGTYVAWEFYPMAIGVLGISLIPGFLLSGLVINSRVRKYATPSAIGLGFEPRDFAATRFPVEIIHRIKEVERRMRRLRELIQECRTGISGHLSPTFGSGKLSAR